MDYYVKKVIVLKILENVTLRIRLAGALGLGERAIWNFCKNYLEHPIPNSNLTKKAALVYLETEGYKEDDVLTTEKPAE